jgi:glycolate oxidase iron-sulfur subunit
MQTHFSPDQLQRASVQEADRILRACVHCGFCTATCPTYALLGDELDSPRGRIYLIKDMLEKDKPATAAITKHIDRCLSCLSCMTTCPSGVDYMHLIDQARVHVEKTAPRPWTDRLIRRLLRTMMPYPLRFRLMVRAARLGVPLLSRLPGKMAQRLSTMARAAVAQPLKTPGPASLPGTFHPKDKASPRVLRVALLAGCVQPSLDPDINEATVRLLTQMGAEVVLPPGQGCCGALTHHLGDRDSAVIQARRNVQAWWALHQKGGLDAVVITASGCGTTIKDYGHLLADDPTWAEPAATLAALACDVSEVIERLSRTHPLPPMPDSHPGRSLPVAYHSACSLQHGQKIRTLPQALLRTVGFTVSEPTDPHLCCGSAGTYSLLQPELSGQLRQRKVDTLAATGAKVVAAGNMGCIKHIGQQAQTPVIHTVQLLDWACGGPRPPGLE